MESYRAGIDPAIRSFYSEYPEEERLDSGSFQIERERTKVVVSRYLSPPPGVVLDVGGGAGAYAFWLAGLGYDVHLVDPVDRLVRVAEQRSARGTNSLGSAEVGDARALSFSEDSADYVLVLGPLYHLITSHDRDRALAEAFRVLRRGGLLFAACISRWASLLDGITRDLVANPEFVSIMEADVKTGQHRNPTENPQYFTTAYFHTPEEIAKEVTGSGFLLEGVYGLEGPAAMLVDFEERWSDPRMREDLLRAAELVESEPSLLGISPHLLAVGRKP